MQKVWVLEVCLFTMIAVGFLLGKKTILGQNAERMLTDLVILVVLPCNILTSFTGQKGEGLTGDLLGIFVVSIALQAFSVLYGRWRYRKEPLDRQMNLRYATLASNAGFLGNPVAEGVFGPVGLMLASVYLIPQRIMMWSEGIAIYSGTSDRKATIKKVVTHPCVIACVLGLILMTSGVELPEAVLTPIQTIGRCNTALSMMVIGMILSKMDLRRMWDTSIVLYTLERLLLIPLLVFLFCRLLSLSDLVTGVSTLLAAMPAAATTSMLANKYDRNPAFATQTVIFSTLCSMPAIALWSTILT
ncbi:MAG: AEC family transporter [Clostridia bacterium]|nr:AEC family transporter [Clostridia bacterium]